MVNRWFVLFLFPFFSWGNIEIRSKVSQNPVGLNQSFDLIVYVVSNERVRVKPLNFPSSVEGIVLQGTSTSSQIVQKYDSTQGSSKEFQKNFYFSLLTTQEGEWILPPLNIEVNGRVYKTQSHKVRVSSQIPPRFQLNPSNPFKLFDIFEDSSPDLKDIKNALNLKASVNKKKIYLGEMLFVNWHIYKKRHINFPISIQESGNIQPENFWLHRVKEISSIEFDQVVQEKGVSYFKGLLSSYILFPLKTGRLKIDPLTIKLSVSDLFSFFSNSVTLKSSTILIDVLPLPEIGKGNFTEAVGEFLVQAQVNSQTVKSSDLVSYQIKFEGQGGVNGIKLPDWPINSDFKVYNVLESQNFSPQKSTKIFEILLIPQKSGNLKTPHFKWTTFNPNLESYVEHEIPSLSIKVESSSNEEISQKIGESFLGNIQNNTSKKSLENSIQKFIYKYFWFLFSITFLIISLFLLIRYRFLIFKKPQKNLGKLLLRGCTKARALKNHEKYSEVGVLLLKIIDQIWISLTGTMGRDVDVLLKKCPPSVRLEIGQNLQNLIEKLEFLSFAPHEAHPWTESEIENLIKETEILISRFLKYYKEI